ncbi:terpenoid synthase, partial [Sistotremastrum niveocremeum HHB9708]
HVCWTIPAALLLGCLHWPLRTKRDAFKINVLIAIAVVSTIPWDSYLIRTKVWSYPPDRVLGPTIFAIPAEELFFFVIQTYITATWYSLISKPVIHATLVKKSKFWWTGSTAQIWSINAIVGFMIVRRGGPAAYMGLILLWAAPFLSFLSFMSYPHFSSMPMYVTWTSVLVPTAYLWLVDSLALSHGTWKIEDGTKLGFSLWGNFDVEEATFFLLTNMLIVYGLVAVDHACAIIDAFPKLFPEVRAYKTPPFMSLVKALLIPPARYPISELDNLKDAVTVLQRHSKSFHFASMFFPDSCRIWLLSLYAFARVTDDLVDDPVDAETAIANVKNLRQYIDHVYSPDYPNKPLATASLKGNFPATAHPALSLLPTLSLHLPKRSFHDLVDGYESDLKFLPIRDSSSRSSLIDSLPIKSEADLITYCRRVASSVGEMVAACTWISSDPSQVPRDKEEKRWILDRASDMGVALQLVNIARDIVADARNRRVYIPLEWFQSSDFHQRLLEDPSDTSLLPQLRETALRFVKLAWGYYESSQSALDKLPPECRHGSRIAIEVYLDIGREIERRGGDVRTRTVTSRWSKMRTVVKILYGL